MLKHPPSKKVFSRKYEWCISGGVETTAKENPWVVRIGGGCAKGMTHKICCHQLVFLCCHLKCHVNYQISL